MISQILKRSIFCLLLFTLSWQICKTEPYQLNIEEQTELRLVTTLQDKIKLNNNVEPIVFSASAQSEKMISAFQKWLNIDLLKQDDKVIIDANNLRRIKKINKINPFNFFFITKLFQIIMNENLRFTNQKHVLLNKKIYIQENVTLSFTNNKLKIICSKLFKNIIENDLKTLFNITNEEGPFEDNPRPLNENTNEYTLKDSYKNTLVGLQDLFGNIPLTKKDRLTLERQAERQEELRRVAERKEERMAKKKDELSRMTKTQEELSRIEERVKLINEEAKNIKTSQEKDMNIERQEELRSIREELKVIYEQETDINTDIQQEELRGITEEGTLLDEEENNINTENQRLRRYIIENIRKIRAAETLIDLSSGNKKMTNRQMMINSYLLQREEKRLQEEKEKEQQQRNLNNVLELKRAQRQSNKEKEELRPLLLSAEEELKQRIEALQRKRAKGKSNIDDKDLPAILPEITDNSNSDNLLEPVMIKPFSTNEDP
jgi:hypothetical protein